MLRLNNVAPLKGGYMITSMVGFIISAIFIYNLRDDTGTVYPWAPAWGLTFMIFFVIMFVAAMISMTYGPEEAMLHVGHKKI